MDGSNSCEQQTKQKRGMGLSLVFGATGGIFRLGCGLLALRAARALACATLPRKTATLRRFFLAASNPPQIADQKEKGHRAFSFWCDRRDLLFAFAMEACLRFAHRAPPLAQSGAGKRSTGSFSDPPSKSL